jgi:hypothetical protein
MFPASLAVACERRSSGLDRLLGRLVPMVIDAPTVRAIRLTAAERRSAKVTTRNRPLQPLRRSGPWLGTGADTAVGENYQLVQAMFATSRVRSGQHGEPARRVR